MIGEKREKKGRAKEREQNSNEEIANIQHD